MIPEGLLQLCIDENNQLWWVVPRALIVLCGVMYVIERGINSDLDYPVSKESKDFIEENEKTKKFPFNLCRILFVCFFLRILFTCLRDFSHPNFTVAAPVYVSKLEAFMHMVYWSGIFPLWTWHEKERRFPPSK